MRLWRRTQTRTVSNQRSNPDVPREGHPTCDSAACSANGPRNSPLLRLPWSHTSPAMCLMFRFRGHLPHLPSIVCCQPFNSVVGIVADAHFDLSAAQFEACLLILELPMISRKLISILALMTAVCCPAFPLVNHVEGAQHIRITGRHLRTRTTQFFERSRTTESTRQGGSEFFRS